MNYEHRMQCTIQFLQTFKGMYYIMIWKSNIILLLMGITGSSKILTFEGKIFKLTLQQWVDK